MMKASRYQLFFLILICSTSLISFVGGQYGEESSSLGQFVDDFNDLDNVSVNVNVIRNSTYNAIELNSSSNPFLDFGHGYEITVDHDLIDANLTDFPVLINVSESSGVNNENVTGIFDEIGWSYQKLAITDESRSLQYFIDVEYWNVSERLGWLWTSFNVSNLENTTVRLFYDGSAANNSDYVGLSGSVNASNVWDINFMCVLHLNQKTGDFLDSSRYQRNASEVGDGVTRDRYIIDGGIDTAGTNDYAQIDTAGFDGGLDELTVEIWVNADAFAAADKSPIGDWGGAQQTFLLYFDKDPNNKWRWLVRDSDINARDVYFGDTPPTSGTLYYLGGSFTRNDFVYGYQNGVRTTGDATGNFPTDTTASKIAIGEEFAGGNKDWDGKLDEVRISNVTRSQEYFNATDYTGRDALIMWSESFFMGYSTSGYFTTSDYLDQINGSVLVQMTNATIPALTGITVEFSSNNSTWVNSTALTDGFQSIDLRTLNWSSSYYLRYNFSGTPAITPRLYQSRVITTEGIPTYQNVTGVWTFYNASEVGVTVGVLDAGNLASLHVLDGDTYNVSEVAGAPGMQISVNYTGIDPDTESVWIISYYLYDGNQVHDFDLEVWNFTGGSWLEFGHFVDGLVFEFNNATVYPLRIPSEFLSNGQMRFRFDHESAGNINHDLFLDYVNVLGHVPGDVEAGVVEGDLTPFIAIAIILSCITYLLARSR